MLSNRYESVEDFMMALDQQKVAQHPKEPVDSSFATIIDDEPEDEIVKISNDTGKIRIEYYPSVFSEMEEQVIIITPRQVKYCKGHNLDNPFRKEEFKWRSFGISLYTFKQFQNDFNNLNISIDPSASSRGDFGTDNERIKIVFYDKYDNEYLKVWKHRWYDEYGGGKDGVINGNPFQLFKKIAKVIPKEPQQRPKKTFEEEQTALKVRENIAPIAEKESLRIPVILKVLVFMAFLLGVTFFIISLS